VPQLSPFDQNTTHYAWTEPYSSGGGYILHCRTAQTRVCQQSWKEYCMYIGGGLVGTILIVLLVLFVMGRI